MKALKYAAWGLGALLVLAGAFIIYVAATFDPNRFKPHLVQAVKDKTQRTLRLDGDIALSLWPSLGAKIGKASLSERASDREFARMEAAHVSLKLLPLLSREAVVDTVRIKGLRANLVKAKDGSTNLDDLAGAPSKEAPAQGGPGYAVDIAGVVIEDAALTYTDQAAGTRYALSRLDLKSGRIAPGVPAKIELSFHAQSDRPALNLRGALKARLTFVPGKSLAAEDLDLSASGAAAGISDLVLKATGGAMADTATGAYSADQLNVTLTGKRGKESLDVRVAAPRLRLAADQASGEKVSLVAALSGPDGSMRATLTLPGIEGTSEAFRSAAAQLDLDVTRGDLAFKAKMTSSLTGNAKARQASFPQLKAVIQASGPNLPGKGVAGEVAGSASFDGARQSAQASLAGNLAESRIQAQLRVSDFAPLTVTFNLDVDQLDADRYLASGKAGGGAQGGGAKGGKDGEQPFDLTALRDLRATGKMHFGSLKARNVKASDVRLEVKANGGRVEVSPLTARFYQGSLSSAITINAKPAAPAFEVKHAMTGIDVGAFLRDLADNDTLEGRGNVTLDVTTRGNTVSALKKALDGKASLKVTDGAIKGIDIAGAVRNARARLGALRGEQTQPTDKQQKTDFSDLTASFNIRNGVARNNDLAMKSPLLRAGGEGDINIGGDTIDYLLKASIVGTTKGQGGRGVEDLKGVTVPVRVTGALDSPSYKLDFGALVTDTARQRVTEEIEKRFGGGTPATGAGKEKKDAAPKEGGSTRDKIRGILGR